MNPKSLRVDLVDGDVDMLVVFVVVANGDVLVLRESEDIHKVLHNAPELLGVQASILWVKCDDEVIGALRARAGVLRLDCLHQVARELEIICPCDPQEIRSQEPRCSRLGASAPDIAGELTKALVG
jgi:hypothetical protein